MAQMVYGDITPAVAAWASVQMLKRGLPFEVFGKFGQAVTIPNNNTSTAKFRRYEALSLATTPLVESVTPSGKKLTVTDYTLTLSQYGDFVTFTDIIQDTHTDPVLQQMTQILGEQATQTVETIRYNVLKAGTNKFYANGTARTDVNTPISQSKLRNITRALLRQNARMITSYVSSNPSFRVEPLEAAFIAVCHPDLDSDIRNLPGFISTKQYGTVTPYENEIGAMENFRFLRSTLCTPYADGGAATSTMLTTTGSNADVYPVIILGQDCYGNVALRGQASLTPMIVNPKAVSGDPLGQRGTAGWKTMQGSIILNDAWMAVLETAVTA